MSSESNKGKRNPFWQFSLDYYAKPGVQAICLKLQNEHEADVNVLLYALWLAGQGRVLCMSELLRSEELVEVQAAVRDLREYRSHQRGKVNSQVYQQLKDRELQAEKIVQDVLFDHINVFSQRSEQGEAQLAAQNLEACLSELDKFSGEWLVARFIET